MAKSGMSDSDVEDGKGSGKKGEKKHQKNPDKKNINATESICLVGKPMKTTTPISILIESLVKNLCTFYESEDKNARKMYNYICEKLFEMNLIDESYNMTEFEGMRNQYQRAFFHLLTKARGGEQPAVRPVWPNNDVTAEWSHYYREFDEIEYIAGGGFGQVILLCTFLELVKLIDTKLFLEFS